MISLGIDSEFKKYNHVRRKRQGKSTRSPELKKGLQKPLADWQTLVWDLL